MRPTRARLNRILPQKAGQWYFCRHQQLLAQTRISQGAMAILWAGVTPGNRIYLG
jgi:hypothetical protein